MKTILLLAVMCLSAGCAYLQQPAYPDDLSGVQWRQRIGAYRGI